MKRIIPIFMIVILLFTMVGCAGTENNNSDISQNIESVDTELGTSENIGSEDSENTKSTDIGSGASEKVEDTDEESGASENTESTEKDSEVSESIESTAEESDTPDEEKSGKVLVAYYSATGTTEQIARIIADYTNADIFVITPQNEYTSEDLDWTNDDARVSVEHNNPDSRNVELVSTIPENFGDYDTVFIGYPIWWGIAAWPVDNFVKENDFTGKTVIPFCTAASSDIGESGELLAEMAGTGNWQQGRRFYGNSGEDEINSWLEALNY